MATTTAIALTPAAANVPALDPEQQWLEERRSFIGGSEIYELLNEKQYGRGCSRALGYRKLDITPDYPEQLDEALMKRGHILEPVAAAMYEEETGRKMRRAPSDPITGLPKVQRHPGFPWAGVHVDRIVLTGSGFTEPKDYMVRDTGSAEIKSRGEGPWWRVMKDGLFPGDILQIQHAMFVKNHSWGPFIMVGLFGSMPLKHFDVQRDEGAIDMIKREGEKFASYVWGKEELPPPPFASDDARCKVCAFRMDCRGEELDAAAAKAQKADKAGKKALIQISNLELAQACADRELVKAEIRAITNPEPSKAHPEPGTLDLIEARIDELLKDEKGQPIEAAYVEGYGKVYNSLTAGRSSIATGDLMKFIFDTAEMAKPVAEAADALLAFSEKELTEHLRNILSSSSILAKAVKDMPSVVATKFTKVGSPYRTKKFYPIQAV